MTATERALLLAVTDAVVAHLRNPMSPDEAHDALAAIGRLKAKVIEEIAIGRVAAAGVNPVWSPGAVEAARDRVEAGDA